MREEEGAEEGGDGKDGRAGCRQNSRVAGERTLCSIRPLSCSCGPTCGGTICVYHLYAGSLRTLSVSVVGPASEPLFVSLPSQRMCLHTSPGT